MPKPLSRWATSAPMRPRPTMPTVFSSSSTPVYLLRFHSPSLSAWLAGAMLRARGEQQADGELGGARRCWRSGR